MAGSFEFSEGQLEILSLTGTEDWLEYIQNDWPKHVKEVEEKIEAERSKPRDQRDMKQLREWLKSIKPVKHILCKNNCIISKGAFKDNKSLVKLSGGNCTIYIEEEAFAGCTELEEVNIPNVRLIGKKAFEGCSNIKGKLDLPVVKTIKEEAFAGCTGLKEINIPEIERIGKNAFKGCSSLEKIEGLAKLIDINSVYNLGCSEKLFENNEFVKLSKLKGSYRENDRDVLSDELYSKYKKFKEKCNNECKDKIAKKGAFKECSRYFMKKVLGLMSETLNKQVENVLNSNSDIKINKNYFSDFDQLVENKCLKVFNSMLGTRDSKTLEKEADSEVRTLQVDIKKYVSTKYNGLLSAGLKDEDISEYFGECFRVLLGFAGLEKLKNINAKEVKRNKHHSSFALGGGGMDLLVAVKEHELM